MEEVYQFLRENPTFFLATMDGDQPRVRPFGAIDLIEGRLYIQTGRVKATIKQLEKNPKLEICGITADGRSWLRVEATAVCDDRREARQHMLDENPALKPMYSADDGNCEVLYLKDATAYFSSFSEPMRVVRF